MTIRRVEFSVRSGLLLLVFLLAPVICRAGILVVSYNGENQAALIDDTTYKVIAVLPTGVGPHEIRISPDGRYAYVAISGKIPNAISNSITVLDLKLRAVKATFVLDKYEKPHDVRVSRDGSRIFVACAPQQAILEVDTETGKILKTYKTNQDGAWFLELSKDEQKIYTPNLEGKSDSVIERATGNVKVIPFDTAIWGIDITRDGKEIWVVREPTIHIIDAKSDSVTATINLTGGPARIKLSPDGRLAVVGIPDAKKVVVIDVKSRKVVKEFGISFESKVIAISGDSRRAFLTNPSDNQITVVDLVNGKQLTTIPTGKMPDGIVWLK